MLIKRIKKNNKKKHTFGLQDREIMKSFIELAEKEGLQVALNELKKQHKGFFNRLQNPSSRGYISFILDTDKKCALDLGCGYGSLSLALSDIFKEVYAFDINELCTKIVDLRVSDKGIKNIKTISGNAFNLDVKKKFDTAFMVGVLEWIPLSSKKEPKEAQKELLRRLYGKLKDGGKIVVGIENRFGAQYFLGRKDHGGLWGTNLVPRKIANIISKAKGKGEYRAYTYTYWQYKRMFEDCGFSNLKIYLPLTSYIFPRFVIPLEKEKFQYAIDNIFIPRFKFEEIMFKLSKFVPFSLVKLFSPHFIIVGEKSNLSRLKKNRKIKDFDKGIIRTGTAIVSVNPKSKKVKKIIHKAKDVPNIRKIKEVDKKVNINIEVPKYIGNIGKYEVFEEPLIKGEKLIPKPKNVRRVSDDIFNFVCELKEENMEIFFRNFNYGNMIVDKGDEVNIFGIRNFKKEDPAMNLISFFESVYSYNKDYSSEKQKEEIWNLFKSYIEKYGNKYSIDLSSLIRRYLKNKEMVWVSHPEFRKRIESKFVLN